MLRRYDQVVINAWGLCFNSFLPSFLFFTNYLKNAISFVNQIARCRQYPSHKMIPINYGVITGGSTWGWRLPCLVPRIQLSCHPETICLVTFIASVSNKSVEEK
jgi:hypothetical protein